MKHLHAQRHPFTSTVLGCYAMPTSEASVSCWQVSRGRLLEPIVICQEHTDWLTYCVYVRGNAHLQVLEGCSHAGKSHVLGVLCFCCQDAS